MDAHPESTRNPARTGTREDPESRGITIVRGESGNDPLEFARAAVSGLSGWPRRLPCRFLYDARGSALFDLITRQPEYYLTRTEASILAASAHRIRAHVGPATLVELGSGSSVKTDYLLRAWLAGAPTVRYIPVDVSETALEAAARAISTSYPPVRVIGMNSDYRGVFPLLRKFSPVLALFLGSTIGNFTSAETSRFLLGLAAGLAPDDFFLVGIDLVKDPRLIEAAYNDAAGVSAEFTRNIFVRMNRELGSGIDLSAVEHVARFDAAEEQVVIGARFLRQQMVRIAPLGRKYTICAGETVETEISRKFRLPGFISVLGDFGLTTERVFTDDDGWFALLLVRRSRFVPCSIPGTKS